VILSDIRRYLQQRGQASLAEIALHFDADPDAVRGMLEVWIRKDKVYKKMATASCGGSCTQCDPAATEVYVWITSKSPLPAALPAGCDRR
jgi:putative ferrous iron transport protein C